MLSCQLSHCTPPCQVPHRGLDEVCYNDRVHPAHGGTVMPLIGLISSDGTSDQEEGLGHCSFPFALELAASGDSSAFPYPYPLLEAIIEGFSKHGDYVSVTNLLHCLRAEYLKRTNNYYLPVEASYTMFRGQLFHSLLEAHPNPNGIVEDKVKRTYRGIELGGTLDSMITYLIETKEGKDFLIQDWKSVKEFPKYKAYPSHIEQVNLYRWLKRLDPARVNISIWYFTMEGVKEYKLRAGRVGRSGRTVFSEIWPDKQVEEFLDDKLVKLQVSLKAKIAMPYRMIEEKQKWECQYCPVKALCTDLADQEQENRWRRNAGLPPLKMESWSANPTEAEPVWTELEHAFQEQMAHSTALIKAQVPSVVADTTTIVTPRKRGRPRRDQGGK
jgi:hypothetical protein